MSKIIFITGPSGSGKSTTAARIAEAWPTTCALIDFDKVRTFVKSGYAEPAHGWDDKTGQQWALAKEVVGAMAQTYLKNEVSVVVEAFAAPDDYASWQQALGDSELQTFALLPALDAAIKRNNERSGAAKMKESDIRQNHEWSEGWHKVEGVTVFDNSTTSVEQLSQEIIRLARPTR